MKRIISILLLSISLFSIGCSSKSGNDLSKGGADEPKQINLEIDGEWQIVDYKILDRYASQGIEVSHYIGNSVKIDNEAIEIVDKQYLGLKYKVKVVNEDYVISYENDYRVENLNFKDKDIRVYVANYKQSNLFEFFYDSEDRSYIYYSGILFDLRRVGELNEPIQVAIMEESDSKKEVKNMHEGIYLGLKRPGSYDLNGNYVQEEYRTLWIEAKGNDISPIYEREDIIFPRINGIWKLEKNSLDKDNLHYEYFEVHSLEGKKEEIKENVIEIKNNVYRTINFVGNDYISTQIYDGYQFNNMYLWNQVVPVDNLNINKGIVLQDLYTIEANDIYKKDYEEKLNQIQEDDKKLLSKYIDYSSFSLERINGKWNIIGRISPTYKNTIYYDFPVNLKPNKRLVNYDMLTIPWKVLKGTFPNIKDAYTSPEGNIAIIIVDGKIQIHKIENGNVQLEPLQVIELKHGETVIMAEWCSSDYVDRWFNVFKDGAVLVK